MPETRTEILQRTGGRPRADKIRLPAVGFLSYARQDDELAGQKLSKLREIIKSEIQLQYGRDTVKLFQDVSTIPHGAAWERETLTALSESTFFIPIITPNFIQSEWCCRETMIFLEREQQLLDLHPDLPPLSRIFPIDYRRIREGNAHDPDILDALKKRQWCNFQDLRDKDPQSEPVSRAIYDFAESICDLLLIEVAAPPSPEELARRKAEAEAARKQEEKEMRRQAAARRRLAREEEEKRAAERAAAEAAQAQAAAEAEAARKAVEEAQQRQAAEARERAEAEKRERAAAQAEADAERARRQEEDRKWREATKATADAAQRQWREQNEARERDELEQRQRNEAERARLAAEEKAARAQEAVAEAARQAAIEEELTSQHEALMAEIRRRALPATVIFLLIVALVVITASVIGSGAGRSPSAEFVQPPMDAPAMSSTPAAAEWLFHSWGMDGDCNTLMTIAAGGGHSIRVSAGGNIEERPILGEPTPTEVRTSVATYTLAPDGTMRTTEVGMDDWVNRQCD